MFGRSGEGVDIKAEFMGHKQVYPPIELGCDSDEDRSPDLTTDVGQPAKHGNLRDQYSESIEDKSFDLTTDVIQHRSSGR